MSTRKESVEFLHEQAQHWEERVKSIENALLDPLSSATPANLDYAKKMLSKFRAAEQHCAKFGRRDLLVWDGTFQEKLMATALMRLMQERRHQVNDKGYTLEADANYKNDELACAAAAYCLAKSARTSNVFVGTKGVPFAYPWEPNTFRSSAGDRVKELEKAGALILAAIEKEINDEIKRGRNRK